MFKDMFVIGENLNATRKIARKSPRVELLDGGRIGIRYTRTDGTQAHLDVTESLADENVKSAPHIKVALETRNSEYVLALAFSQKEAGSDFLDMCVDEASQNRETRYDMIRWLVEKVQKVLPMPFCIDSSDPGVIEAAFEVYDFAKNGTPMINSTNLEPQRLPLIDVAVRHKCKLIVNASGEEGIPSDAEGRVANLIAVSEILQKKGLPEEDRFYDPLVLPISTDSRNGMVFLDSVRGIRTRYPKAHITGGFSNVSFGMPNRKALNEAMTYLAREAGADTAFIDPAQVQDFRPADEDFQKAINALLGKDEFCMEYIAYCRSM